MDPFEVRMQFLGLLRKLDAKQQSIQKVVSFALKHFDRCGEDLWDCVIEECTRGSIHARINILYMLDNLCNAGEGYTKYVARDVDIIVDLVVPDEQDGLLNLMSTRQILENWRSKRIVDPAVVNKVLESLDQRKDGLHAMAASSSRTFHRNDILSRFEEDRERHKRLRERRWVQPVHANAPAPTLFSTTTSALEDVEFSNAWETTSDWNEDDDEAVLEETLLCFPEDIQQQTSDSMQVDRQGN
ncbi:hypothetical protein EXIGLDRAFT_712212 [Exidia glandulosa HHB12029]|uniref:CID domain-containing protein n=1 Tax=Exidia glandulosa HHB12029 TaxID=1314781 RepID=A0A165MKA7_EXIGL|nr:hypothetical protein EXIGLDRAFT_712212 [Exidia glandulosa HHB12029]